MVAAELGAQGVDAVETNMPYPEELGELGSLQLTEEGRAKGASAALARYWPSLSGVSMTSMAAHLVFGSAAAGCGRGGRAARRGHQRGGGGKLQRRARGRRLAGSRVRYRRIPVNRPPVHGPRRPRPLRASGLSVGCHLSALPGCPDKVRGDPAGTAPCDLRRPRPLYTVFIISLFPSRSCGPVAWSRPAGSSSAGATPPRPTENPRV
jgi:hypothetical protein